MGIYKMPSYRKRGGAIRLPSEYFGVNSGRYAPDANAGRMPNAYGYTQAQSNGVSMDGNQVGANMHAHPNATGLQTGGGHRRRSRRQTKRCNRSSRRQSNRRQSNRRQS